MKVESIGLTNELDMGDERRRGINQDGLCSFLLEQQDTNLFEMGKMKGISLGFPNIFVSLKVFCRRAGQPYVLSAFSDHKSS